MECQVITVNGCQITVLFNGLCYLFHNHYFGFLALATRQETDKRDETDFLVLYGNHHCVGGSFTNSRLQSMVKRTINKAENKYISKSVNFEFVEKDLANSFLSISDGFKIH